MLDIKLIIENPEKISAALAKKGCEADFTELLKWDTERRNAIKEVETLKAQKNRVSAEIHNLKKEGKPVDGIFAEMKELGVKIVVKEHGGIYDTAQILKPILMAGNDEYDVMVLNSFYDTGLAVKDTVGSFLNFENMP